MQRMFIEYGREGIVLGIVGEVHSIKRYLDYLCRCNESCRMLTLRGRSLHQFALWSELSKFIIKEDQRIQR